MRILLTGGCGYLGSCLVNHLSDHSLTILDSFLTQRHVTLFNLPQQGVRVIEGDINTYDLEHLCSEHDVTVHLAAITDSAGRTYHPAQVFWVNLHGTERVAMACRSVGCRLVFASSTSVYSLSNGVADEECTELNPPSPYSQSKLRAEQFLQSLSDLKYVTLRFGTIYGLSQGIQFQTSVPRFCYQAALGQPLSVWKSAVNQKRPYLAIGDAVNAILHILEHDLFDRSLFNVVTENAELERVIQAIRRHRPDLKIELTDAPIHNQHSYSVSSAKFRATGWQSQSSLEQGIAEIMQALSRVHG